MFNDIREPNFRLVRMFGIQFWVQLKRFWLDGDHPRNGHRPTIIRWLILYSEVQWTYQVSASYLGHIKQTKRNGTKKTNAHTKPYVGAAPRLFIWWGRGSNRSHQSFEETGNHFTQIGVNKNFLEGVLLFEEKKWNKGKNFKSL